MAAPALLLVALALLAAAGASAAPAWDYGDGALGPARWAELTDDDGATPYAACGGGGGLQSPIDIPANRAFHDHDLSALVLATRKVRRGAAVLNTGAGITLEQRHAAYARRGPLRGTQRLLRVEVHAPSEHTVGGRRFPLELQFVHRERQRGRHGAIVSVLADVDDDGAPASRNALDALLDAAPAAAGDTGTLGKHFYPSRIYGASGHYWTYEGSSTTPPCAEDVTWIVMRDVLMVDRAELERFIALYASNARPVQPLNDRSVRAVGDDDEADSDSDADADADAAAADDGGAPPTQRRADDPPHLANVRSEPMRGVNLGAWLVLEGWLASDVFEANGVSTDDDQYEFCVALGGPAACAAALQEHWATRVSRADLAELSASGVNWLRVPVGFWSFVDTHADDEPFPRGGAELPHLARVLGWAAELSLKVMLDLHALPGSQNGEGHSAAVRRGVVQWHEGDNMARSLDATVAMARFAAAHPAVAALSLVNEPRSTSFGGPITFDALKQYYVDAHALLRSPDVDWRGAIVIADGWRDDRWDGFLVDDARVLLDKHIYYPFGGSRSELPEGDNGEAWVRYACDRDRPRLAALTERVPTLIGEYSLATNARQIDDYVVFEQRFAAAQLQAYGGRGPEAYAGRTVARGGFFWLFTAAGVRNADWNYLKGLRRRDTHPKNSAEFEPDVCDS